MPDAGKVPAAGKPRIVLAIDYADWAFIRIAEAIVAHVPDYEFAIVPLTDLSSDLHLRLMAKDADLIHYFFRGFARNAVSEAYATHKLGQLAPTFRALVDATGAPGLTSGVHDDVDQDEASLAEYREMFQRIRGYYVCNRKLKRRYDAFEGLRRPWGIIDDGVDTALFCPRTGRRERSRPSDPLVVGWVGNADWGAPGHDHKGFHSIVRPAIERLAGTRLQVRGHFAERTLEPIPYEAMPDYYAQIDVLVCASLSEGTPQPVLQAMACGVPIVSTDVGIVRDAFGPLQAGYILRERSVDALSEALARLAGEPETMKAMGAESLRLAPAWDWSRKVPRYGAFFAAMLAAGGSVTPKVGGG